MQVLSHCFLCCPQHRSCFAQSSQSVFSVLPDSRCTMFSETVSVRLDRKAISSVSSSVEYATVSICVLVAFPPRPGDDE